MNKHPERGSTSVNRKSCFLVDWTRRNYVWLLALCLSGVSATGSSGTLLFTQVCPGVSLERAYHRSDVVVEVELDTATPRDTLWFTVEVNQDPNLLARVPYVLRTVRVLNNWKGKTVESVRIYTLFESYPIEEHERHIVFATFNKRIERKRPQGDKITRADGTRESHFMITGDCRGNAILKRDDTSERIKRKLDRLKATRTSSWERSEYTVPLHKLVRTIFASDEQYKPRESSTSCKHNTQVKSP